MLSRIPLTSRGSFTAAGLAAGMLAASMAAPASAPASLAPDARASVRTCSAFATIDRYTYYSDATYTTKVGVAFVDCDGNYSLEQGYATPYYRILSFLCPS